MTFVGRLQPSSKAQRLTSCLATALGLFVLCLALSAPAFAQVPTPTNLTATRQPGGTCAVLAWTDVAMNEGSYEVHRSDPAHADAIVGTAPANATIYTDCTLDPQQGTYNYFLRVFPLRAVGAAFGLDAASGYFEVESSLPTVPRVWGNRVGGLPVSGYCTPYVPTDPDDMTARKCYWPFPDRTRHYRLRGCPVTGCLAVDAWAEEPHLRCGPIMPGGGCECAKWPSEPGCAP